MSIFEKLKSFFAPSVPNPLPPLVQPDPVVVPPTPLPAVEIEKVVTIQPEPTPEPVVAQPEPVVVPQPYQVPVTNTDPTPTHWPFPASHPAEGAQVVKSEVAPVKKPSTPRAPRKTTAKATVKTTTATKTAAKATVKTATRTVKKNK
jgi:fused signal recognition particle receptor